MGEGNGKADLGIRPIGGSVEVQLRIPKIPGADPEVLAVAAQQIMGELQFWAPLTPAQRLADVAGMVLGDVPVLEQIRSKMAQSQPGSTIQLIIARQSLIDPSKAEMELVLRAPTHLDEVFGDTNAMASFVTIVGLLTSPTARALLTLGGRRIRFDGPLAPDVASPGDEDGTA